MHIRLLSFEEYPEALSLAERVFMEFEAPEYSDEGIKSFKEFLRGNEIEKRYCGGAFAMWGAFCGDRLIGIFAVRDNCHISLVFVDKEYHRKGIATMLWNEAKSYFGSKADGMTVNSSPYGKLFYEHIGFKATSPELTTDGIRYIPMKFTIERQ